MAGFGFAVDQAITNLSQEPGNDAKQQAHKEPQAQIKGCVLPDDRICNRCSAEVIAPAD